MSAGRISHRSPRIYLQPGCATPGMAKRYGSMPYFVAVDGFTSRIADTLWFRVCPD